MTDTLHDRSWTIERAVPLPAGGMVLVSIARTSAHSSWWRLLQLLSVPRLATPCPTPTGR
ncbi:MULTISPECIES: DUF2892 domain-containing protein [unclassified Rhodococcus (in: high G+C Gram-positive bacteria)]|uniref:DUF2892 domain-containing protein n=1 Tax=unclassified Rhodococcus (in: high G+C Gram-positive bacteria) TaxID=192944 RepID=UPI0016398038|nr:MULTISPECIES: DUF2892 domain-containing protein [unclassified Rhodococcus (in: high G+C Gram-positive bacteria)]MBC2641898.1 DUF2892 domain-containing protein [Rhodococcus sp. 3A]MBC2893359.1 DUF2892 domain-containing protein [Rhodococcus sp. 4CII]